MSTVTTLEPPHAGPSAFYPYRGRGIRADFVVRPFCGKSVKKNCPECGGQVESDYVACPYSGTSLKSA